MFHEGSLQSGIALAIQQQKLVACFVQGKFVNLQSHGGSGLTDQTDDGATSKEWENEWLNSGWVCYSASIDLEYPPACTCVLS
jgi:hypothetical protein